MNNFAKTLFLFFFLSINFAIISMEKSVSDEPIEEKQAQEKKSLVDLGLPHEIWVHILKLVYHQCLDLSIVDQSIDIYNAVDNIQQNISQCHTTISLVCKTFKNLSLTKKQWKKFRKKIRKFYIPYINEKFLEVRESKKLLHPKNDEWCKSRSLSRHIANYITDLKQNHNLLSDVITFKEKIKLEKTKLIKLLLFYGLNPNNQDKFKWTPLFSAVVHPKSRDCEPDYQTIIVLLLQYGADPNISPEYEESLLYRAVYIHNHPWGNENIISLLLQYGANPNIQPEKSPLYEACLEHNYSNNEHIIALLLQHGANPNILVKGFHLYSILFLCNAPTENENIIALLLQYGANPYIKNENGESFFDLAKEMNFHKFPQLVRKHAKNTLTKICLLHILNNLSLYEDKLNILPIELQDKINSLRSN